MEQESEYTTIGPFWRSVEVTFWNEILICLFKGIFKRILIKSDFYRTAIIINILVSIATIFQFLVSCINVLNMKKPETLGGSFNNYFVLIGCFCSFIVGIIFVVTYNFRYKFLYSKIINLFFLLIVLFASYVHIYQLFIQKELVLASSILILADIFVGYKVIIRAE